MELGSFEHYWVLCLHLDIIKARVLYFIKAAPAEECVGRFNSSADFFATINVKYKLTFNVKAKVTQANAHFFNRCWRYY